MEGCRELQGNLMFPCAFQTRKMGGDETPFVYYTHPEYQGEVTDSAGYAINFGRSVPSFVTDDRRDSLNVASSLSGWIPEDGDCFTERRRCLYGQEGQSQKRERNHGIHKKPRLTWDKELQERFEAAIDELGSENAVPSKILKIMNIPHLTRDNIASHLQKYRRDLRKRYQMSHQGIDQPLKDEEIHDVIISFHSRSLDLQKPRETPESYLEIFEEFQVEDLL